MGLKVALFCRKLKKVSTDYELVEKALNSIDSIIVLNDISNKINKMDVTYIKIRHAINARAVELIRQIRHKQPLQQLENKCNAFGFRRIFYAQSLALEGKLCSFMLDNYDANLSAQVMPLLSDKEDLKKIIRKHDGTQVSCAAMITLVDRIESIEELKQLKSEFANYEYIDERMQLLVRHTDNH
jgi:hypothetical protein